MKRITRCITLMVIGLTYSSVAFSSIDTRAALKKADQLRSRFGNKVYRDQLEPHWVPNHQFWYKIQTGPQSHEFILADTLNGTRKPAFDHPRLAEALQKAGVRDHNPNQLPIDTLEFGPAPDTLKIQVNDVLFSCNLNTYQLQKIGISPSVNSLAAYLPESAPAKSGNSVNQTQVTFINQTQETVLLYWLDTEGKRISYGILNPGQQYLQHTYAGHLWLITKQDGTPLCVFIATQQHARAVIGSEKPIPYRIPRRYSKRLVTSPDGQWTAYIKDHNVELRRVNDANEVVMLTHDGTDRHPYINEFTWSADSKKLVAIHRKIAKPRKVSLVESSPDDQIQPKLHTINYNKPGDELDVDHPCLFDIETKTQIPTSSDLFPNPYQISGTSNPFELSGIHFSPDSQFFYFLYNQRGHQVLRLIKVDARTGETSSAVEETSDTFICYSSKYFCDFVDDSNEIIWMSERDGWNHLYLYDSRTGKVKNQITKGPWVVRKVEYVDKKNRQIYFQAGGLYPQQDPYFIHYARINFDGSGLTLLTEGNGTHQVRFSPDRKYLVDTWSRVDQPPVHELRDGTSGKLIMELERADDDALLRAGWQTPEPFVAKGRDDSTDIYGVIFRPTTFDPNMHYPVVENIYAGPQDSFVPKAFQPYYNSMKMAELGFIVVVIDGMGTSNRSKAFHDVCWKNLADAGLPDRIRWIQAAAKQHPYMDISRVGIYGGSAGGQSAAAAVMTHGDFYKVAIADCGCHDNRMDKIWWNEQWMGWPVGPEYAANSNVTLAKNLTGKLLLMVGELDRNVDPASTMQVVNALIKADKDFDLLVLPGTGHGSAETEYGQYRRADFLVRNLLQPCP